MCRLNYTYSPDVKSEGKSTPWTVWRQCFKNMAMLLGNAPQKKKKPKVGSSRSLANSMPLPPPGSTRLVARFIFAGNSIALIIAAFVTSST